MAETTYPLTPPSYSWVYSDATKTYLDYSTRIATEYDLSDVLIGTRPFTAEENLLADEWAATTTGLSNKSQIETNIEQDYAKMQAIEAQTNADIRADPSQEIKDLARAVRRLDRMALENFSGTD